MPSFVAPFSMKCLSPVVLAFVAVIIVFCPLNAAAGSDHDAGAMSDYFNAEDAGVDDGSVDDAVADNDSEGWFEIPEEQITDDPPDSPPVAALLLFSAEQEQSPTNEPYYLTEPFANINFGGGYFHPARDISSRHGSGFALHLDAMFSGERWAFGPHIRAFFSSSSEERIHALGEPDTRSDPKRLTPRPIAFLAGVTVRYAIHKSKRWFVSVGLTVAMMDYFLTFKETSSKDPDKYKEYERNRTGIAFMEDVDVAYFFASSGEYSVGPYLSLGIAEAYSWDTDEVQPDLGRKDGKVFGLELWPQFILGLKILRGERPGNDVEFNADPDKQPLENRHLRIDLAFGYSHPLGPISRDYPPGPGVQHACPLADEKTRVRDLFRRWSEHFRIRQNHFASQLRIQQQGLAGHPRFKPFRNYNGLRVQSDRRNERVFPSLCRASSRFRMAGYRPRQQDRFKRK